MTVRKLDCPAFGCILYTLWVADFETPAGQQHFFLFLGQHWQKKKILQAGISKSAARTAKIYVPKFIWTKTNLMYKKFRPD
jgi:hypothetical protein